MFEAATSVEAILKSSAPAWVDMLFIILVSASAVMNLYLGFWRINQSHGKLLIARRIIGVSEFALSMRLIYVAMTYGELPMSYWTILPIAGIEVGMMMVGVERIKVGRDTSV
jgi:hypothetical protein